MFTKKSPIILFVAVMTIVQLACNAQANSSTPDPFATLNGLYTASAQTLEAAGTPISPTPTPGLPLPTATLVVSPPTMTPFATVAAPTSRCDAAQFLADVTYPDGSLVARKSSFVKIWRIKNIGACSWTTSYSLVFVGGDQMSGPSDVGLAGNVNPGQYIEIPVTFKAPNDDGKFRGYWKLRNASGVLFGIGAQADSSVWVDVKVKGDSYTAYEFVAKYCDASWRNKKEALPCPGTEGDARGFVLKLDAPVLENDATATTPGLLTFPQDKENGIVRGEFPAFSVQDGDHFRATVGCQIKAKKCNVIFRLDYTFKGETKTLESWHEVYEGKVYPIDLDLSALAGKSVKFILFVSANGSNDKDSAVWLNPRITRLGSPPATPTPTPTSTSAP
ncbi:MAG: hypothetical protein HZB50_11645 [Chloroflexi bacterium]|nr:hypothetical protein [Chloroflexota bacterium]